MKRVIRLLGLPVFSYEEILTESDLTLISNTSGDYSFGFQSDEDDEYEDDDYELSPDDPVGFGFGGSP